MSLIEPTVSPREARMVALSTGDPLDDYGTERHCAAPSCSALLSRYNPGATCSVHRGWRVTEQRRRRR